MPQSSFGPSQLLGCKYKLLNPLVLLANEPKSPHFGVSIAGVHAITIDFIDNQVWLLGIGVSDDVTNTVAEA